MTTLLALLGFDQSHLGGGTARVSQDLVVVQVTVRSIATTDAAVVAEQRDSSIGRAIQRRLQDLHTVADVALDVEQVGRSAAPLSTVKRHDLHQSARANRAAGMRIEGRVFGEKNTNQKRRVDVLLVGLVHDGVGDTERQGAIVRVLIQNLTNAKRLLGGL